MVAQNATKWSLKHLDYSTIYNTICIITFRLLDNIEWVGVLYQIIILSCGFKKLVELQGSNEDISPIMFCETCHDIVRLILIHNFWVKCVPFDTLTIFGLCSKNTCRINLEYKQAGPQFSRFQAKLKQAIVKYVDESQQSQMDNHHTSW